MPRPRLPIHSKANGPARIGAALNDRWREVDRQAVETAKARLDTSFRSITQPIIDAADEERLSDQDWFSQDEKRRLAVRLNLQIGQPAVHIDVLCREIWMPEQEEAFRAWERQGELPMYSLGRPVSNEARGRRLQRAVELCAASLQVKPNPDDFALGPVIVRLATICFDLIVSDLGRLKILGICKYCDKTMFPSIATKRYCSLQYEGRDCGHRHSSKTYDTKHRSR